LTPKLPINIPAVSAKPTQFRKPRSSSPLSDETNNIIKPDIPHMVLNKKLDPSIEERNDSPSPLPNSDDSAIVSENENKERPKSIQSVN
jgi:hypothetical protein